MSAESPVPTEYDIIQAQIEELQVIKNVVANLALRVTKLERDEQDRREIALLAKRLDATGG